MFEYFYTIKTASTSMQPRLCVQEGEGGPREEGIEGVEDKKEGSKGEVKDVDRLEERPGTGNQWNSTHTGQGHDLHFLYW